MTTRARAMEPAALVLIHEDDVAQKLLATWPRCSHDPRPSNVEGHNVALKYAIELARPRFEEWARISGVDLALIEDKAFVLFGNGICSPYGTTSDHALSFVAQRMLRVVANETRRAAAKVK